MMVTRLAWIAHRLLRIAKGEINVGRFVSVYVMYVGRRVV